MYYKKNYNKQNIDNNYYYNKKINKINHRNNLKKE